MNSSRQRPHLVDFLLFGLDAVNQRGAGPRRQIHKDLERVCLYLWTQVAAFVDRTIEEHTRRPFKVNFRVVGGKRKRESREYVNTVVAGVAERLFAQKDPVISKKCYILQSSYTLRLDYYWELDPDAIELSTFNSPQ